MENAVSCYKSGLTHSLIAKLPQRLSLAVHEFVPQTKNTTNKATDGVCETLTLDVVAPEAH